MEVEKLREQKQTTLVVGVLTEKERRIIDAEPKSKTSWAAITIVLLHQIEGEINRLQIEQEIKHD